MVKPAAYWLEMEVQNSIGHEKWGVYSAFLSLCFLFIVLADLGLSQYYTKAIAVNPDDNKTLFGQVLGFKIMAIILFPAVMVGIGLLFGYTLDLMLNLFLIGLITAVIQTYTFFGGALQGMQMFKIHAFASNVDKLLLIIFVGILLYTGLQLESFIYARLGSIVIATIIMFLILSSKKLVHAPTFNPGKIKKLLGSSLPFALIIILFAIHEKVDQVMLERILPNGKYATGLYSASYRWLDLSMMYLWIILPMFFAKLAFHKTSVKDKNQLVATGTSITAIPLILVGGFGIVHGKQLFFVFGNSTPTEIFIMTTCLSILFACLILNGFFAILGTYLTSNGHTGFINKTMIVSIALNIILNFIFIPDYGPVASAWTTLASTLFAYIIYLIYIRFYTTLKLPIVNWLKLIAVATTYIALLILTVNQGLEWYMSTIIATIPSLVLAYVLGLINFGKLKHL